MLTPGPELVGVDVHSVAGTHKCCCTDQEGMRERRVASRLSDLPHNLGHVAMGGSSWTVGAPARSARFEYGFARPPSTTNCYQLRGQQLADPLVAQEAHCHDP